MTDPVESVVDMLADKAKCRKKGAATGAAFIIGSPAWKWCVRVNGHDGECVLGVSEIEQARLDDRLHGEQMWLVAPVSDIRRRKRIADAAWMT
jgi:hypothetical protein